MAVCYSSNRTLIQVLLLSRGPAIIPTNVEVALELDVESRLEVF